MLNNRKELHVLLVGIAGSADDFLLAPPLLKCFVDADEDIRKKVQIDVAQFIYIARENREETCRKILIELEQAAPNLIGFSAYVWNYDAVLLLSELVRESMPETKIVWGGPEVASEDVGKGKVKWR
jgi:hypothetical protein